MPMGEDTMRIDARFLLVGVVVWMMSACASKPASSPPQVDHVRYRPKAIEIYLKADAQLNLYEGSPNSLRVCIYQLRDPNSFNQYAQEREGLRKLLEGERFDGSVTNAKKVVVQPGREETMSLDRAEGTRYVGVVAGYYLLDSLEKDKLVRLFEIPVLVEKKGIIRKKKTIKPASICTWHRTVFRNSRENDGYSATAFLASGAVFAAAAFSIGRSVP